MNVDVFTNEDLFAAKNKWSCATDDIANNFPSCLFLLHQEDVNDGETTWTDRVNGAIVTDATGFQKDAKGVRRVGAVTIAGTMPEPGAKQFCLIWTGEIGAANHNVQLGDVNNGPGVGMTGGVSQYTTFDASNYFIETALSGPPAYPLNALAVHIDTAANELRKTGANSAGDESGTATKGTGAGTLNQTWPALGNEILLPSNALSGVDMLALFAFTTAPTDTDVEQAVKWMAANPGKLYPGFAGRT